jgi:protein-tyrosine phosphatase
MAEAARREGIRRLRPITEAISVLTVCTGNICRSPMAQVMLRSRLEAIGVDCDVTSAGFVTEDRPASPPAVDLLAGRGLDLRSHRSRRLTAELLGDRDLILCMERRHVREIAVLDRDAFERAFTFPELARRAEATGPRRPGEGVRDWLRRISSGRRPTDVLGVDPTDEVADPYGRNAAAYRRTAEHLDELLDVVVPHLFPAATPAG